jgi:hypothetical protein
MTDLGKRNPVTEVLSLLAAAAVAIIAFVFGAVLLAVVVGLIALGALAFSLRLWWLRRKLGQAVGQPGADSPRVIEAEYTIVTSQERRRNSSGD